MKIVVLGKEGQLGWELVRLLQALGEVVALDFPKVDMANPDTIRAVVRGSRPQLIINATAFTDVDKAETLPELALAINGTGPGVLAEEAKKQNAGLIHFSTDYVFDGNKGSQYSENDPPNPINIYGTSKLAGEQAVQQSGAIHLVLRTSWVYSLRRPCFVTKLLEWAETRQVLRVVDDQVSSPTSAQMLAEATAQIITMGRADPLGYLQKNSGLYHLSGSGYCSRYEWACETIKFAGVEGRVQVQPAKSSEFPGPAQRPLFSVMNCDRFQNVFGIHLPDWKAGLQMMFKDVQPG
jgi:dTDP-4-dehydrorhamnose reductase